MRKLKVKDLFNEIISKYEYEMNIHAGECDDGRPYSLVFYNEIVLPQKVFNKPSRWDVFCLLHEIGHIKTNTIFMPMYEKEYLATQWSVDEAKRIGFKIDPIWKDCFQDYIWKFMDSENIDKRMPPKESMRIKW